MKKVLKRIFLIYYAIFTTITFASRAICTETEDDIFGEIPEFYEILLIGPANSGKTFLKNCLDINKKPCKFSETYAPSIPGVVNYGWADVDGKGIRLIEIAGTADDKYEEAIKTVLQRPLRICLLCLACNELEKDLGYYTNLINKYNLASRTFICVTKCDDFVSLHIADNLTKIIPDNGYKEEVLYTSSKINGYKKCFPASYTGEVQTTITDDMPQDLLVLAESEPKMESISNDNRKNFKTYTKTSIVTAGIVSMGVILGKLISRESKNIKANKTQRLEISKTKQSAMLTT